MATLVSTIILFALWYILQFFSKKTRSVRLRDDLQFASFALFTALCIVLLYSDLKEGPSALMASWIAYPVHFFASFALLALSVGCIILIVQELTDAYLRDRHEHWVQMAQQTVNTMENDET